MKKFFRIISYIKGYWRYAILNIVFNILSVVFSLFSLTMIAPFLDLLFLKTDDDYKVRMAKGIPELHLSVHAAIDNFYYYFTKMIVENSKMDALIFICVLVTVMILFKNLFR